MLGVCIVDPFSISPLICFDHFYFHSFCLYAFFHFL
uniref:Uncharacterized protein n=1 Tax=Rhizophora mucronata TaxID=61149 RepID=A0A2P2N9M6_RHIMU